MRFTWNKVFGLGLAFDTQYITDIERDNWPDNNYNGYYIRKELRYKIFLGNLMITGGFPLEKWIHCK
jgi:hypothetical protein